MLHLSMCSITGWSLASGQVHRVVQHLRWGLNSFLPCDAIWGHGLLRIKSIRISIMNTKRYNLKVRGYNYVQRELMATQFLLLGLQQSVSGSNISRMHLCAQGRNG